MVTISSCISEYPCSFGRKVLGEILSAPGLEVCAMRALQTAFEVEAPCGFKGAECCGSRYVTFRVPLSTKRFLLP